MTSFVHRLIRVTGLSIASLVVIVVAFALFVQFAWDRPVTRPTLPMSAPRDAAHVTRGKYLYERSLLCWGCHGSQGGHSPDEPQAGGREFDLTSIGPGFGFVYGSNLTPDVSTGIGAWSDGELVRAIREGVTRDGRLIFPVMAYQFYHGLSDDDALAIVAYLRSLPPVPNRVSPRRLSFVAKAMHAIGLIRPEPPITRPIMAPLPEQATEYGEYIAWRTAGCAECHTPRDPKTARLIPDGPLSGGLFPFPEPEFTTTGPNLTPDIATGIGTWTEEQFVTAMQTGARPDGKVMLPFMPWPSYARWSRNDLHAVWLYLRSLKPIAHRVPPSVLRDTGAEAVGLPRGQVFYNAYCLPCHGERGSGGPSTTLALREQVRGLDDEAIIDFVAEGAPGAMPGFGRTLTREQLADLVAFMRGW